MFTGVGNCRTNSPLPGTRLTPVKSYYWKLNLSFCEYFVQDTRINVPKVLQQLFKTFFNKTSTLESQDNKTVALLFANFWTLINPCKQTQKTSNSQLYFQIVFEKRNSFSSWFNSTRTSVYSIYRRFHLSIPVAPNQQHQLYTKVALFKLFKTSKNHFTIQIPLLLTWFNFSVISFSFFSLIWWYPMIPY